MKEKSAPHVRSAPALTSSASNAPLPKVRSAARQEARPADAIAPLSPATVSGTRPSGWKVGGAALLGVIAASVAGRLMLRPPAAAPRPAPAQLAVTSKEQQAIPARITYSVRVGPYQKPSSVQQVHKQLRSLGFEPILVYHADGTYLQAITTPEEPKAVKIVRGLNQEGIRAVVAETRPEHGLLKGVGAEGPHYRVAGVLVDFEAGQSKGWEHSGSAIALRNSSLLTFSGEHSLEVSLRQTTHLAPGAVRLKPESVVLPQDRFLARVLQPTSVGGRLSAALYAIDARGKVFHNMSQPLDAGKWVELQLVISPRVALPLQEIGIEFRTAREPWTGTVYVDRVEQQRPS